MKLAFLTAYNLEDMICCKIVIPLWVSKVSSQTYVVAMGFPQTISWPRLDSVGSTPLLYWLCVMRVQEPGMCLAHTRFWLTVLSVHGKMGRFPPQEQEQCPQEGRRRGSFEFGTPEKTSWGWVGGFKDFQTGKGQGKAKAR